MKTYFLSVMAASLAGIMMTSCESASKLSNDIQGSWSGAPERLIAGNSTPSSYIPVLTFTKTGNTEGNVNINASISLSESSDNGASISAAGQSTISGTWTATDDDEIYVNLDPTTLNVIVDPDAVTMSSNNITGVNDVATDTLKTAMIPAIKEHMTSAIRYHLLNMGKIDDIKIKNGIMTCEIGEKDYSFRSVK